jgi:hypothetical protein
MSRFASRHRQTGRLRAMRFGVPRRSSRESMGERRREKRRAALRSHAARGGPTDSTIAQPNKRHRGNASDRVASDQTAALAALRDVFRASESGLTIRPAARDTIPPASRRSENARLKAFALRLRAIRNPLRVFVSFVVRGYGYS